MTYYSYPDLASSISSMRSALEGAIAKDRAEAESFWAHLASVIKNGFDYFKKKREFDAQVAGLIERARGAVSDAEAVVNGPFQEKQNAARDLEGYRTTWLEESRKALLQKGKLSELSNVEGWEGLSATNYVTAVEIQVQAMSELSGIMQSAARGADQAALFNKVLMSAAVTAVRDYQAKADVDRPGGNGIYYLRTANWGDYITLLPSVLTQIAWAEPVAGPVGQLGVKLDQTLHSTALLEEGSWPGGTSAAGVPAANTGNVVPSPDDVSAPVQVPPSQTSGVCTFGATR